jgi:hypothetical protein
VNLIEVSTITVLLAIATTASIATPQSHDSLAVQGANVVNSALQTATADALRTGHAVIAVAPLDTNTSLLKVYDGPPGGAVTLLAMLPMPAEMMLADGAATYGLAFAANGQISVLEGWTDGSAPPAGTACTTLPVSFTGPTTVGSANGPWQETATIDCVLPKITRPTFAE